VARKRLIKGANAARVEERIARVPADVPSPVTGQGASIFGALRSMEEGKSSPRKPAAKKPAVKKPAARKPAAQKDEPPAPRGGQTLSEPRPKALAPSDFNAAEREAIVRCCSDYRNHLPTYLIEVQKEVRIIDSVIDKCRSSEGKPRKA
jgi:hypothetical protein